MASCALIEGDTNWSIGPKDSLQYIKKDMIGSMKV